MERLTYWENGKWRLKFGDTEFAGDWVDRIAAYEDTGLEPEEIKELCTDDVAEVAKMFRKMIESGEIDHLRELVQAEKDGRLVVLPCKIGDTVYMPVGRWNAITGFEEDKCDGFHIDRDGILQIKAQVYRGNHWPYGFPGKTAFLTREEAEATLKGGDEG